MRQFSLFESTLWTVSKLTRYLREIFESNPALQDVWIEGEVSNISRPVSGHVYLTLKDSTSSLQCVIWRNTAAKMPSILHEGEAIEAHGSINIYETAGRYQLYIDEIRPVGQGKLYEEFLRRKSRLEAEGLFDSSRKRAIPLFPEKIGIVTSPSGAAIRDILNTISRRYPLAQVIVAPTQVQGAEAPGEIIAAIQVLNQAIQPDVIILARGGGSIEDLWAFNDEMVARAVADSDAPIISGVGHETDFTIVDFVSDLRAPTPTAAAELATPDQLDLRASLFELNNRMSRTLKDAISLKRLAGAQLERRLKSYSPIVQIRTGRQRLDDDTHSLEVALNHDLQLKNLKYSNLVHRLLSLNPQAVLKRGYAIIKRIDGKLVRSTRQIELGMNINVQVSDGQFGAEITSLPKHAKGKL